MDSPRDDDARFTALFRELYPRLCRFLGGMLADPRRAEELAQESLLRLYRSSMRSAPEGDARNWVFRVGRNLALNERKRVATVERLTPLRALDVGAAAPSPEQALHHKQELAFIWRLVRKLPERQRAALLLREHEQMTYEQIADVLSLTLANVKVTIFRARQTIRRRWNERYEAPATERKAQGDSTR